MATLCPTCHSDIGSGSTAEDQREQGIQGLDTLGNPIPRWSDDPLFTTPALNGDTYRGDNRPRFKHIQELQTSRIQQESDLGFSLSLTTQFSDVTTEIKITERHIVELRESTEKILASIGLTLTEYFSFDDSANVVAQNPLIEQIGGANPQIEWVDVDRGRPYIDTTGNLKSIFSETDATTKPSPTLSKDIHIRAIHIEDLRHPIFLGTPALLLGVTTSSNQIFHGRKAIKSSKFLFVEAC